MAHESLGRDALLISVAASLNPDHHHVYVAPEARVDRPASRRQASTDEYSFGYTCPKLCVGQQTILQVRQGNARRSRILTDECLP